MTPNTFFEKLWENLQFFNLFGSPKFRDHFIFCIILEPVNYYDTVIISIFQYILFILHKPVCSESLGRFPVAAKIKFTNFLV